jgi:hypothetical protein
VLAKESKLRRGRNPTWLRGLLKSPKEKIPPPVYLPNSYTAIQNLYCPHGGECHWTMLKRVRSKSDEKILLLHGHFQRSQRGHLLGLLVVAAIAGELNWGVAERFQHLSQPQRSGSSHFPYSIQIYGDGNLFSHLA